MINLIPPAARRVVTREYWLRVVVVWLFLAAIAFGVVGVMMAPSYVLIVTQLSVFTEQYNEAQLKQDEFKKSETVIKDTNALAAYIAGPGKTTAYSTYLTALDTIAGRGIAISQFDFNTEGTTIETIEIIGVATSRAALTNFSDTIESNDLFSEAQVPIENLAQDSNITFNLMVVPNNET